MRETLRTSSYAGWVVTVGFVALMAAIGFVTTRFTGDIADADIVHRIEDYVFVGADGFFRFIIVVSVVCGGILIAHETWKLLRNPQTRGQTVLWIFALIGAFQVLVWVFK